MASYLFNTYTGGTSYTKSYAKIQTLTEEQSNTLVFDKSRHSIWTHGEEYGYNKTLKTDGTSYTSGSFVAYLKEDNDNIIVSYGNNVKYATNLLGGQPGFIPYQSAENTTTFLPGVNTANYVLKYNKTTNAPVWDINNMTSSEQSTDKLFLIGGKTQATSVVTYSNATCYLDNTQMFTSKTARIYDNNVYIGSGTNNQCHEQYDTTNKCLKFIFD